MFVRKDIQLVVSTIIKRPAQFIVGQLADWQAARQVNITSWSPPRSISINDTYSRLKATNLPIVSAVLDENEVADFAQQAEYEFYYPNYYVGRDLARLKKIREHFAAAKLLELTKTDVYLDIASQNSPAPQIYERLFGCQVLRQDLEYAPGRNGRLIGGSAGSMPLPNGAVTKMAMHCSLEHFEGDQDIAFIQEAERVLAVGGRLAIVPLYLSDSYFVVTQPSQWARLPEASRPAFPPDAVIYGSQQSGNRFERYYDAPHLIERLIRSTSMSATIYSYGEALTCMPGQLRFAAVFQRER